MANQQAQDLRPIYHHIIDDVVAKMKPSFLQESVDESVLQTLRQRWAQKLVEKGIIAEPEAKPEAVIKKDDDLKATHKRPHDGSGPNSRMDVAAAAAAAAAGGQIPVKTPPHLLMQQRLAQQPVPPGVPGLRVPHPTAMPLARPNATGPGGLSALQQHQGLPQGFQQQLPVQPNMLLQGLANVQGVTPQQQQQALQMHLQSFAQQRNNALRPPALGGSIPGQPPSAGLQANPNAAAAVQQLRAAAGLQPQGLPHQVLLQQQGLQQQGLTQQQQQLLQQQQQGLLQQTLQQQGIRMPGVPGAVAQSTALQGLLQQGVLQQRIPQGDGSADMPPSMEEVAAAAGMQPEQLRALLPGRVAAIIDGGKASSSGSLAGPSSSVAGAGRAAAAAAGAGVSGLGGLQGSAGRAKQRHGSQRRGVIPQVDGEGDEEEYDDEDGDDAGEEAAAADEENVDDGSDLDDDDTDDPEMAKFAADLDAEEEAEKEETGDLGFALYEKVHRAKNRWRCNLRYGVFLINGKEYMFHKGTTDFTF